MIIPVNQDIIDWARQAHLENYIVLDTETTGGARYDEVVDLGIVEAKNGRVIYDGLFRPEQAVNPHAFAVHRITDDELLAAPRFKSRVEKFYKILETRTIIAYNSTFDERLMLQTFERYGIKPPRMKFVCAMQKYKHYAWLPKVLSLTKACQALNVTAGSHRAVTDALAAARVVFRMKQGYTPNNYES